MTKKRDGNKNVNTFHPSSWPSSTKEPLLRNDKNKNLRANGVYQGGGSELYGKIE